MTKIMDAWDKRILCEMEFDYRKPHQEIARKIKRSKAFVGYRIKKMVEEGLISFHPLIDYSCLGYTYYRVIIETILEKKDIVQHIRQSVKTIWLVEKYDQENFVLVIAARSYSEFQAIWESLYERIAPQVLSKDISIAYRVYHMPLTFLTRHKRDDFRITGASAPFELGTAEQRIVDSLVKKPEASLKELGKAAGVSANTLKKLLDGLQKNGVIKGFQVLVNKEVLGIQHYKLFLSFDFTAKNKLKAIELLKNNPNVVYITETSYNYDLECELYTFDNAAFEKIVRELRIGFPFSRIVISQMKSEEKLS
jgi:DNA-binding Lrp family transcriptional regulator